MLRDCTIHYIKRNWFTTESIINCFWYENNCCLFTNWPGILWMGFVSEISWPEMYAGTLFIPENSNTLGRQTRLYYKRVAIFRNKLYPNRSISQVLCILLSYYHNFLKTICFLPNWTCACNFIQVRIFKNIDFWKSKWNIDVLHFQLLWCEEAFFKDKLKKVIYLEMKNHWKKACWTIQLVNKFFTPQHIKMGSCVFHCDVPHQCIAQWQVGPVSVYCDGVGCRVLCLYTVTGWGVVSCVCILWPGWVSCSVSAAWHSCVATHWSKYHCYKQALSNTTSDV